MTEPARRSPNERIRDTLAGCGVAFEMLQFPASTRTATEAAAAIGCRVEQIAKSIVFRAAEKPLLVVACGPNRIDEARLSTVLGCPLEKANAGFVREHTGFVIGGVAPFAHPQPIPTLLDQELFQVGELWASAGTPNSVFRLSAETLLKLTAGTVIAVT